MVKRTPGVFDYYQDIHRGVNGDTIRTDAENPGLQAKTIHALAGELEADDRRVASQLSGEITTTVSANPKTLSGNAATLAANGHYAVGLVLEFAGMVDTFDVSVNNLNTSVRSGAATATRYAGEAASYQGTEFNQNTYEKTATADMKKFYAGDYQEAVAKLDADADTVATKFHQGPTPANVRKLILAGLLPLSAASLYPGLKLTPAQVARYWKKQIHKHAVPAFWKMSARQRKEFLRANPYLLPALRSDTNPDSATRDLIVALTMPSGLSFKTAQSHAAAFFKTLKRLPGPGDTDWKLAAMLDPHSQLPKYKGTNAVIAVAKITPRPGEGLTRIGLFIPSAIAFNVPHDDLGDNRGMNAKFAPDQTRVALYVDWDTGTVVARQNPSVDTDGDVKVGTPSIQLQESDTGAVHITYLATNPFAPPDPTDSHHVHGDITITPGPHARVDGTIGDYPSFEAYHDTGDGRTKTLVNDPADNSGEYGALLQLPYQHDIGYGQAPAAQFSEWRNLSGDNWIKHMTAPTTQLGDPADPPTAHSFKPYGGTLYHPDAPGVYGVPHSGVSETLA